LRLSGFAPAVGNTSAAGPAFGRLALSTRDQVADRVRDLPWALEDLELDVATLQVDVNQWSGTKMAAPKLGLPSRDDGALAELLRSQLEEARRANYLQAQQFGALKGFMPPLTGRMVGSFAHGVMRVPETGMAYVHKDEKIIPDPLGPYGSQLAGRGGDRPIMVELHFAGKSRELVRLIDARIDDRAPRVASRETGRMSRLIVAAPGR
jgi:hypothetical protein